MADIYIGYIILCVALALFAVFITLFFVLGRKIKLPDGKQYRYTHNGFTAIVIVDNSIPRFNTGFIFQGNKIDGEKLAKSCAVSMESVDIAAKTIGPENLKKAKQVKECVFVLLDSAAFTEKLEKSNLRGMEFVQGFAVTISSPNGRTKEMYCCYMRAKHMPEILKSGQLAVHEFIHCYSHKITNSWDHTHSIWAHQEQEKNIDQIACERVKNIMNLDNSP